MTAECSSTSSESTQSTTTSSCRLSSDVDAAVSSLVEMEQLNQLPLEERVLSLQSLVSDQDLMIKRLMEQDQNKHAEIEQLRQTVLMLRTELIRASGLSETQLMEEAAKANVEEYQRLQQEHSANYIRDYVASSASHSSNSHSSNVKMEPHPTTDRNNNNSSSNTTEAQPHLSHLVNHPEEIQRLENQLHSIRAQMDVSSSVQLTTESSGNKFLESHDFPSHFHHPHLRPNNTHDSNNNSSPHHHLHHLVNPHALQLSNASFTSYPSIAPSSLASSPSSASSAKRMKLQSTVKLGKRPWTDQEDKALIEAVAESGVKVRPFTFYVLSSIG